MFVLRANVHPLHSYICQMPKLIQCCQPICPQNREEAQFHHQCLWEALTPVGLEYGGRPWRPGGLVAYIYVYRYWYRFDIQNNRYQYQFDILNIGISIEKK